MKENLIVIEKIMFQWISSNMSTNCPSPLLIIKIKNRASRNIVGGRELLPDIIYMDQLFIFISSFIIFSVIMTITSVNPIHSIFWLVLVFINSAGLLITLNFDFIALMLIIIYVGAITILFLFVIMMLDVLQLKKIGKINHIIPIIIIISINIFNQLIWLLTNNNLIFNSFINFKSWEFDNMSHITTLGVLLYTEYYYPFIILSILLLVAMVGAIILTLEIGMITRRQGLSNQHQRNNSWV